MLKNWDKLRFFYTIAKESNLSKAARVLNISQSSLSRHIIALEQNLEIKLFTRHARGLILTEQGEALFHTVSSIYNNLSVTISNIQVETQIPKGELVITTTAEFGTIYLIPKIKLWSDLYPQLKIKILFSNAELDLSRREADVAFRMYKPTQDDLIATPFLSINRDLYASKDYLKAYPKISNLKDLENHKIIATAENPRKGVSTEYIANERWVLSNYNLNRSPLEPFLEINSTIGIYQAAVKGLGIGILPNYVSHNFPFDLVHVLPRIRLPGIACYFVYHKDMNQSTKVRMFKDFIYQVKDT